MQRKSVILRALFIILFLFTYIIFTAKTLTQLNSELNPSIDYFPSSSWNTTYGGSRSDKGYSVIQTNDGGFVLAGGTESFGNGETDMWLVKTDSSGNELWNQTYGGSGTEFIATVVKTSDDGFAFISATDTNEVQRNNMWLVKTDSSGNELWNQTFSFWGPVGNNPHLIETSDGGFAFAGRTVTLQAELNAILVKTDKNGVQLWNRTYGGTGDITAYKVLETSDDGFILFGRIEPFGDEELKMWLMKTDKNGNQLWNQTYGGIRRDAGNAIISTLDGGFALVGSTLSYGAGNWDMWLVKTDENGQHLWNQTYGGAGWDSGIDLVATSNGGFIIAGTTRSFGTGDWDMWLVKTDPNGQHLWNQTYGGLGDEKVEKLIPTKDGGVALVGRNSSGEFNFDIDNIFDMMFVKIEVNTSTINKFEIIINFIQDNPESLLIFSPILFVIYLLYRAKRNIKFDKRQVELYPPSE